MILYTEGMKTTILMIRHGQTAMNHAKLLHGSLTASENNHIQ
jgi:broad specificity phosphatase PhoE